MQLELSSLNCLREITKATAIAVTGSKETKSLLEVWVDTLVPECLKYLAGDEIKFAKPCGKILMACASANPTACALFCKIIPTLLKQYKNEITMPRRKVLLEVVVDLITASKLVNGARENDEVVLTAISDYKDVLVEEFVAVVVGPDSALRNVAVLGIYVLISSQGILKSNDIALLMEHLISLGLDDAEESVTKEVIKHLRSLSAEQPSLIKNICFPLLFDAILQSDLHKTKAALNILEAVSAPDSLFPDVIAKLMNTLDSFTSKNVELGQNLFICIHECLMQRIQVEQSGTSLISTLINHIYAWFNNRKINEYTMNDPKMINTFGRILSLFTRSLDSKEQSKLISTLLKFNGTTEDIPKNSNLAFLYQCVLVYARQETDLQIPNLAEFLTKFVEAAMDKDEVYKLAIGSIFASIVNKLTSGIIGLIRLAN